MAAIFNRKSFTGVVNQMLSLQQTTKWLLLGYKEPNSRQIELLSSGENGIQELAGNLNEDMVGYAYVRIPYKEDKNKETLTDQDFVHITFIGDNVKPQERARSAVHRLDVRQEIPRFLTEIEVNGLSELTEEFIMDEVNKILVQLDM